MQNTRVVTPAPKAPLPTYSGDADQNRFVVATPHFNKTFREVAAAASYAGTKLEIGVPTSLTDRLVYADIAAEDGGADVGSCTGELKFYLGGTPVLTLPFDFLPGNVAGMGKNIGFHVTSGGITNAAINTLGIDVGTGARLIVPPWALKIACSKIELALDNGNANAAVRCYVVLACLSQGRES